MNKSQQKGFTLVEMSIVLVIIGLIVGGVLVGQDLVKGAQIRATVSQIESFNSAINTFRGKYDCMPGDCAKAVAYGLADNTGGAGAIGNGVIDASALGIWTSEETDFFWQHLSNANMVAGNFAGIGTIAGTDFPATKLKKGGIAIVNNSTAVPVSGGISAGTNVWIVGTGTSLAAVGNLTEATLNATEAFGIDNKIDDGMPLTGQGIAVAPTPASGAGTDIVFAAVGDNVCKGTSADYAIGVETNACSLIIKVQG